MTSLKRFLFIPFAVLFCVSTLVQAEDNRYYNIQQATHISDGWIGYSNGELYRCQLANKPDTGKPNCVKATGLPSSFHKVELLWADGNEAWVSYSNGQVYGCRDTQGALPRCDKANGLP